MQVNNYYQKIYHLVAGGQARQARDLIMRNGWSAKYADDLISGIQAELAEIRRQVREQELRERKPRQRKLFPRWNFLMLSIAAVGFAACS
ncbi:MAG: hypothetical protein P8074_25570 [Anaerolineales bacterium]|jgi:hypothetical protein